MSPGLVLAARLGALAATGAALWALERRYPLFPSARLRERLANLGLTALTLAVYALLGGASVALSLWTATHDVGLLRGIGSPWLAGALGVVGLDLFAYFAHASMHKVPWLWRAHRVHHCDLSVDVTTTFRQHPLESLWRVAWQLAAIAVFGIGPVALLVYLSLSGLNALLEHANVRVPLALDAAAQRVWVTPNMHKWHHSRVARETDSNYGNLLSSWDQVFGTWTRPAELSRLRYGLDQHDDPAAQTAAGLLKLPFASLG